MSTAADVRVLTARRAYEFAADDLRLTMMCTEAVIRHIAEALHFGAAAMATPPATFGPVPNTLPAGVVFQVGTWVRPDDSQMVPIRFLNIEPQRIVIDVAGPSSALDGIYSRIVEEVSPITAPDGHPIIGEPARVLHFSELSVSVPMPVDHILEPGLHDLFTRYLPDIDQREDTVLVPSLQFRALSRHDEYSGNITLSDGHTFALSPRAGGSPEQRTLYSCAPLETERHMELVSRLLELLAPASSS